MAHFRLPSFRPRLNCADRLAYNCLTSDAHTANSPSCSNFHLLVDGVVALPALGFWRRSLNGRRVSPPSYAHSEVGAGHSAPGAAPCPQPSMAGARSHWMSARHAHLPLPVCVCVCVGVGGAATTRRCDCPTASVAVCLHAASPPSQSFRSDSDSDRRIGPALHCTVAHGTLRHHQLRIWRRAAAGAAAGTDRATGQRPATRCLRSACMVDASLTLLVHG